MPEGPTFSVSSISLGEDDAHEFLTNPQLLADASERRAKGNPHKGGYIVEVEVCYDEQHGNVSGTELLRILLLGIAYLPVEDEDPDRAIQLDGEILDSSPLKLVKLAWNYLRDFGVGHEVPLKAARSLQSTPA